MSTWIEKKAKRFGLETVGKCRELEEWASQHRDSEHQGR